MALDTNSRSRRALLAGALTGAGAAVLGALTKPLSVRGAGDDGSNIAIGGLYANAQSQTTLANGTSNQRVLWVASNNTTPPGSGTALTGFSATGVGVEGWSNGSFSSGVYGHSSAGEGVRGETATGFGVRGDASGVDGTGVWGTGITTGTRGSSTAGIGVRGDSEDQPGIHGWSMNSTGVYGRSGDLVETGFQADTGVYGLAVDTTASRGVWGKTFSGVGVFGQATRKNGYAFRGTGRVRFDKVSGVATIQAGRSSVTVNPGVDIAASSFVLLSPRTALGGRDLWFTTNPSTNRFTIRMSSTRGAATKVAWLLLG